MRYDNLAQQLRLDPRRYLWFGPWWWTIKKAMNDTGERMGPEDDAGTRALLEKVAGGPEEALKRAMRHYTLTTGAMPNHKFTLPSGEPYFLYDEDVTARAMT